MSEIKKKIDWLRIIVHAGAWITLAVLVIRYLTDTLTVNPIQAIERQTGKTALIFLMLSLSCSPLGAILDWKDLAKRKKALGVYGFMFAAIHLLLFLGLDYGFQFAIAWKVIFNTVYIWFGLAAFFMLSLLAFTTFKKMKQLLKKNWKRLHRLVYIISPLAVIHFFLVLKGNILTLQGDIKEPFIYGSIVLFLLVLRIPPIKRALINLRVSIQNRFAKPNPV